jgi:redox-sensitive bicupin YhaK (pirin superfamily)
VYAADSAIWVGDTELRQGKLAVLPTGTDVPVRAANAARAIIFGGDPLDSQRHLWWNFVSSSRDRIERAKADWAESRFPAVVGETEFIPLPR